MTGMLVDGDWRETREWTSKKSGTFNRRPTTFRDVIQRPSDSVPNPRFTPESGRYRLYVSYACPWAHRTLITRALLGLSAHIDMAAVHPFMGKDSWHFGAGKGVIPDPDGAEFMREVYLRADPKLTGVVTVPVLWDTQHKTIVNNESREIIRMLNTAFSEIADGPSMAPEALRADIDATLDAIYQPINNGVYRAGFARTQDAYETAATELFAALHKWEAHLGEHRYLCGDTLTEADVCLFTTLIRFDPVYHTHFKCNLRRIQDYPNLSGFMRELYQMPAVRQTVNFEHIKQHYFTSHESVNPHRIVPIGQAMDLDRPHGRG